MSETLQTVESFTLPEKMFIYPTQRSSPQGRNSYSFVRADGTKIPANRTFARESVKYYSFPSSSDGMSLNTGMEKMMENPFTNKKMATKIGSAWHDHRERLTTAEQITVQEYLEVLDNVDPGTYRATKNIIKPFSQKAEDDLVASYLERFRYGFNDTTNILTSDNQQGRLAMMMVLANPRIANDKSDANPSIHDFYIGEEFEAQKEKKSKRKQVAEGITALEMLRTKYDDFVLYQFAVVLDLIKGEASAVAVSEKLDDYVWTQSKDQIKRAQELFALASSYIKRKEAREKFYLRYLVKQAENNGILVINSGNYIWRSKEGVPNLYNLGRRIGPIIEMFREESSKYDPKLSGQDNYYGDLLSELRARGVKLLEDQ